MSVECMYAYLLVCIHMGAQLHEHVHMSSVKRVGCGICSTMITSYVIFHRKTPISKFLRK